MYAQLTDVGVLPMIAFMLTHRQVLNPAAARVEDVDGEPVLIIRRGGKPWPVVCDHAEVGTRWLDRVAWLADAGWLTLAQDANTVRIGRGPRLREAVS
jgi:hypothetical protein